MLAVNTDAHALGSSISPQKISMGSRAARGLGAGGDPEIGAAAAEESMTELRAATDGMDIVVLCAGLGGGTGSGALPLIASCAKLSGAWVVAFATLPFAFEGKRRIRQAKLAVDEVAKYADVVVCFENDRMSELTRPLNGVGETFDAADQTICRALRMFFQMLTLPGRFRLTLADLHGLLSGRDPRCLLGVGSASGPNRVHDAVAMALKSPMLSKGRALAGSPRVLVHLAGPESLSLAETGAVMGEIQKHADADVLFSLGMGFLPEGSDLTVSILGCSGPRSDEEESSQPAEAASRPARTGAASGASRRTGGVKAKGSGLQQETLPLDIAARGRFEKSEPTIIEGEDLDVPTFLRQKIKLK